MDNIKEQERAELHKTIWAIANDLRGSVDGWDFKAYVLGMLFYRYISENLTDFINQNERESGNKDFDYRELSDEEANAIKEDIVTLKGFFILPSELFSSVVKDCMSNKDLNITLKNIFTNIESSAKGTASQESIEGLFSDFDVTSNKLGGTQEERQKKLALLMTKVDSMKLGNYQDNTIDAFGDAYEYLMGMYASNAGKSGGEYFTPQEVSELLARITLGDKTSVNKVYDPACGSGSLLLKFAKIIGKDNVTHGFFGQELNITTYNLCRINMFLHDISYDKFNIAHGDTLLNPSVRHKDEEPFEAIVSNPPYATKWEGSDNVNIKNDERFNLVGAYAPKSKADFAFVLHCLHWLAENGTAAIVCFPGIMYRNGAEQKIRKYLVDNNYVDCIIELPKNLFFGTSISTNILVLKKSKKEAKTLFIDASKEFVKVTNNNKLTDENIEKILGYYNNYEDVQYISKVVSNDEISEQGYNLSVSTYVEPEDTREKIDIKVLNAEIEKIVERENVLREEIRKIIEELES